MKKSVVFLGSYMHCIFGMGDEIPKAGETVNGYGYAVDYSGKGSSQAMQCARMGSDVKYIGRLGDDAEGRAALELFRTSGLISDEYITIDREHRTGIAIILTDRHGNNSIMVVPGANDALTEEDVDACSHMIAQAGIMSFVFEANHRVSEYGIKKAHAMGIKTFLDPSPAAPISPDVYPHITYLKPNEHEAGVLTGIQVSGPDTAVKAGRILLDRGVEHVIITMGKAGCVLVEQEEAWYFRPPKIKAVDSTSAGDVFGGTLVAMISQDRDLKTAIAYASCAGALATTVVTPILDVLPGRDAVEAKVREYCGREGWAMRLDA